MNTPSWRDRLLLQEDLNFLLTNRIPRLALTRLMGRYSRIRSRWLTRLSIAVWRWFTDLDLSESAQQEFDSLHACFTRALRPGARPFVPDPTLLASPCDAIVGECGPVQGQQVWQAKGFPYTLADLMGSAELAARHADGQFVTLRLTSSMYHRFHAPHDLAVERVTYISGDTWNVNPIALRRVERLFCKNERAVIETRLAADGSRLTLVPVAAVLVASIRLHALDVRLHLGYRGPHAIPCAARYAKGDEMGWFEHGSTILVFVPPGWALADGVAAGQRVRAGQALLRRVPSPAPSAGTAEPGP
ncbi:archaetidylserine decarboxylase [Aquabacterium sp. A08]|uniref:archaetidylserine decarboxylase n=1 Tax=Aquabacterium sp. A08 TaxID=2718532 RepID=UPI00142402D4|nr:archaetidylserine decarboxylase [Aquabacterium sp. A08]NIC40100.1 phosphatidylserine decarboxylase [Aquabacterium sp. A08]